MIDECDSSKGLSCQGKNGTKKCAYDTNMNKILIINDQLK